ncbi:MAG: PAS domain-containing protein [Chthoniobacterales bacterium]
MSQIIPQELLSEYEILDTAPEKDFDDFTILASQICGTPVSLISILAEGRQWFKSHLGVEIAETPIDYAFCTHAVEQGSLMEVADLSLDPRFKDNPFVSDEPMVRFYAGVPLVNPEGYGIGTLCVLDTKPRKLDESQRMALNVLGRQLSNLFELRRTAHLLRDSREREKEANRCLEVLVETRTAKLRESEERFTQLAENSLDVFWFLDLEPERILYVSPSVEKLWGVPAEKFYEDPKHWMEAVYPEDRAKILSVMAEVSARKLRSIELEYRIILPTGGIRWIHYRGTVIREAGDKSVRLGGIAKDVTERRLSEEKLKLTLQRLQLAAKASGVGIWDLDLVSGELQWDDEIYALYGLSVEKAAPGYQRWSDSLHPEDRDRALAWVDSAINSDVPLSAEFRIVRQSDMATRYIRAIAAVFKDDTGKAVRLIGTNWDSTEDRENERSLEQALEQQKRLTKAAEAGDHAKREFLAAMSHEIRTPLNGMLGFAEIASDLEGLPAEAKQYIDTIAESGQALLRIINDILDFSRLEAGKVSIEKVLFSPKELTESIRQFFVPQAQIKGLKIESTIADDMPNTVLGDSGRIRQILLNLVGNAMKFTDSGGIKIEARCVTRLSRGRMLELWVEDTGPGIPPDKWDSIFSPFTQADLSNARRHGGTGLGLAISSKLAELMGGSLTGQNLSVGTRFTLLVPIEVRQNTAPGEPVPIQPIEDGKLPLTKILVAEDDRINLKLILNLLRSMGYEAVTANNGAEAVRIFLEESPDCVFMDVQMPELDGIEATRRIREIEQEKGSSPTFIMAFTADVMPENRKNCFAAGMNGYLNKPIKKQEVADALRQAAAFRACQ